MPLPILHSRLDRVPTHTSLNFRHLVRKRVILHNFRVSEWYATLLLTAVQSRDIIQNQLIDHDVDVRFLSIELRAALFPSPDLVMLDVEDAAVHLLDGYEEHSEVALAAGLLKDLVIREVFL
jgi:hypothetical protein